MRADLKFLSDLKILFQETDLEWLFWRFIVQKRFIVVKRLRKSCQFKEVKMSILVDTYPLEQPLERRCGVRTHADSVVNVDDLNTKDSLLLGF